MTTRRILVLSDVHSNRPALRAVREDAKSHGPYDMCVNLGDLVGYGPFPNESVSEMRDTASIHLRGNHDRVVRRVYSTGSTRRFNPYAYNAAHINRRLLTTESRKFLQGLSNIPFVDPEGRFAAVHGSFAGCEKGEEGDRYEDIYVIDEYDAIYAMRALCFYNDTEGGYSHPTLGLVGHTHIPMYATMWAGYPEGHDRVVFHRYADEGCITLVFGDKPPTPRYLDILWKPKALFNPGSVGQPRNGDPRAAWGIVELNDNEITLHFMRTVYDIAETQEQMRKLEIDRLLIDRLAEGR